MRALIVVFAVVLAACGGTTRDGASKRETIASRPFAPLTLRQPAVFVRVQLGYGQWSDRQKSSLPAEYEGALVEAMNARAVLARDVRLLAPRDALDRTVALTRAREVGADHAVLVEAKIEQTEREFCKGTRAAFRRLTTVWTQRLVAVRASDGAVAFETLNPVEVTGFEPDCDAPRESRTRSPADELAHAVETLVARLLGS